MLHIIPFLDDTVLHGVGDLKHRPSCCCLVTAHNVFDDKAIIALFFGSQDGSANDRGVLELGEVLTEGNRVRELSERVGIQGAYLCCVANFEETSSSVKDCMVD